MSTDLEVLGEDTHCTHKITVSKTVENSYRAYFNATHQVRLYADPGSEITIKICKDDVEGHMNWMVTISGYLVPAGSTSLAP